MKYATWNLYFPDGGKYGYTADQEIVKKGFRAWGMFYINETTIFGTFEEGADTSGLENYAFHELTTEEAESILLMAADGQETYM
jgi:hypothetical protein